MRYSFLFALLTAIAGISARAQNLPSLVLNRNINSTFSIVGYDPQAKEWGITVATNNIYVGNSTCYIQPGIGAISVIAETEPAYGINGLEQLKQGRSMEEAINYCRSKDTMADYRQVSGIDGRGNAYAFTGSSLQYWKGTSTHHIGKFHVVMGNQLAEATLSAMSAAFEQANGTLAQRLLKSLIAGEKAGGQITGKQSAALIVKGEENEWFNQIDLRVDHSRDPFTDLQRLLNYHYGRIQVNQAMNAIGMKDLSRGRQLLADAEKKTVGWYGLYSNIAKAHLMLGERAAAIRLIKAAISGEPKWKENVPAFYCLYDDPTIRSLYPERQFSVIDWGNAISMLTDLNRNGEAIGLARKMVKKYPGSSYLWYLLARAERDAGDGEAAVRDNGTALKFDPGNADAGRFQKELDRK
ncbi:MAG TPA: DUF1028 domain-containing protein [Puia sp.]